MAKKNDTTPVWYALAVTRILLGFIFLWAFFDKLWGLGFATKTARAWVNGGSPTTGFLKGVEGPFAGFFTSIAGAGWADWLFMLGLLGLGVSLILGIGVRIAAVAGALLVLLMWAASLPLTTNPLIDDHIVYAVILIAIGYGATSQRWSIAGWWRSLSFVKKNAWLW